MLNKQPVTINFSQGLETKTDPFQVPVGKFLKLQNSVFNKGGLLSKRNGYGPLPVLPDATSLFLTTFNGDLTAIGTHLRSYSANYGQYSNRGAIQPVSVTTLPLVRSNTSQTQVDAVVAPNGLVCTVFTDQDPSNLSASIYRYAVSDSETGQIVVAPTTLASADATMGVPRAFVLGSYFIILYTGASPYPINYIAINTTDPTLTPATGVITSSSGPSTQVAFDGAVLNNLLYVAWNAASSGGIRIASITSSLTVSSSTNPDSAHTATKVSVCADAIHNTIWVSYYSSATNNLYFFVRDLGNNAVYGPAALTFAGGGATLSQLGSVANQGVCTFFFDVTHAYSYDSSVPSHFINCSTVTQAGVVTSSTTPLRSVGLASKPFLVNGAVYSLFAYTSPYQKTYFLADVNGNLIAKLAYGNGGGYYSTALPSVSVSGTEAQVGYLFQDLIQSVNKNTNVPSGNQTAGVYAQTGLNLATFNIEASGTLSAEIGNNLNLSGGFLWGYDGYTPTEQGFFVWPDSIKVTTSTTGGSLSAQPYFYQVTYEWTDNQGNIFRSAPSVPVSITTTGATSSNTINVPTLRLTYKTANPVKVVVYRWSAAQEVYYQVTSITSPLLNITTSDEVSFLDTLADADILGNNILYTNGGILEDVGGPALDSVFIFDDRLWGIDSEDKNLLWYSKQVIEATPVEMSDLLTLYVPPSIGAQGPTGNLRCGAQMDDKAILFKASAINYIAGTGPDNTGANSQYSQPQFITSTVGCSNQKSIVFMPQGLMFEFQSESGNQIWLLGRDLTTRYIGAEVEAYTQNATVSSAVNIPGANQVRFTLNSGITLMYDYYYNQWGTFINVPAISSTIYQGLHTYLNSFGQVFQETPGAYLDHTSPVLMSFTTSWINLAGLQGYQRAYFTTVLGTYYSPHKLNVQLAYDYSPFPSSQVIITPNNYSPTYGADLTYGSGDPYGGSPSLEQWKIHFAQQRCQAFQITMTEIYDASYGVVAGKGLTLSGLNCIIGVKKGYRPFSSSNQVGAS